MLTLQEPNQMEAVIKVPNPGLPYWCKGPKPSGPGLVPARCALAGCWNQDQTCGLWDTSVSSIASYYVRHTLYHDNRS